MRYVSRSISCSCLISLLNRIGRVEYTCSVSILYARTLYHLTLQWFVLDTRTLSVSCCVVHLLNLHRRQIFGQRYAVTYTSFLKPRTSKLVMLGKKNSNNISCTLWRLKLIYFIYNFWARVIPRTCYVSATHSSQLMLFRKISMHNSGNKKTHMHIVWAARRSLMLQQVLHTSAV